MNKQVDIYIPLDARKLACDTVWPVAEVQLKQLIEVIESLGWKANVLHEGFVTRVVDGINTVKKSTGSRLITFLPGWAYPDFVVSPLKHLPAEHPRLLLGSLISDYPGAVGLLAAASGLEHCGIPFSRIYVEHFDKTEDYRDPLAQFLETGSYTAPAQPLIDVAVSDSDREKARSTVESLSGQIYGCVGPRSMEMWNKISEDDFLNVFGVSKLSFDQLRLVKMIEEISDERAWEAFNFLKENGMEFRMGDDPTAELTEEMVLFQMKAYWAFLDLAEEFGLDFISTQDQLDLIKWYPVTDLPLGMLNNRLRPGGKGETLVAATEADDGAAITMQVLKLLQGGQPSGFNDLRYWDKSQNLYWLVNSGSLAPFFAQGSNDTLDGSWSERQTPMYFIQGGGTCTVVCKIPGVMTWARFGCRNGKIYLCAGRGVTSVPTEEQWLERSDRCNRDWPQWYVHLCGEVENFMHSNHPMAAIGDHLGALKAVADELNIPFECYDHTTPEKMATAK